MSFLIDDTLLRRLAEVNSFPVPENGFNSEDGIVRPQTAAALGIDLGMAQ